MTQEIIVALIVAAAAISALWRWMPAGWRRHAAGLVAAGSQRTGLVDAERAQHLADSLAKSSGCGACESCDSCGSSSTGKSAANGAATVASGDKPATQAR